MSRTALIVAILTIAALAFGQKPPTAAQRKAAKAHFNQGRAYYDAGAWDEAIREYQQAYQLAPLPELQFNIGQAWRMKGDKPKAIAAYQRYLEVVSEGALAEEARNHVAALQLKIKIDEAEEARRKAAEEAAAARAQAAAEAAARKRAEAEAAARAGRQRVDEETLRRVAAEEAEAARRRKEAAEAARATKLEEARGHGYALRVIGTVALVAGAISLAGMGAAYGIGNDKAKKLRSWSESENNEAWRVDGDDWVRELKTAKTAMYALGGTAAALIVVGAITLTVGSQARSRAVERIPAVGVAAGPAGGSLVLSGRF